MKALNAKKKRQTASAYDTAAANYASSAIWQAVPPFVALQIKQTAVWLKHADPEAAYAFLQAFGAEEIYELDAITEMNFSFVAEMASEAFAAIPEHLREMGGGVSTHSPLSAIPAPLLGRAVPRADLKGV